MNRPLFRNFKGSSQDSARSRRTTERRSDLRRDDWRDFADDFAADEGARLDEGDDEFDHESEDPFEGVAQRVAKAKRRVSRDQEPRQPRYPDPNEIAESAAALVTRRVAAGERQTARALENLTELIETSQRNNLDPGALDEAVDAFERRVDQSERKTVKALENIAEMIGSEAKNRSRTAEDFDLLLDRLGRIEGKLAQQAESARLRAPRTGATGLDRSSERERAADFEQAFSGLDQRLADIAARLDADARRRDAKQEALDGPSHRAMERGLEAPPAPAPAKRQLADAILDITRRQHALDVEAIASEPGRRPESRGLDSVLAGKRFDELQEAVGALSRRLESLQSGEGDRSEQQLVMMRQIEALRRQLDDAARSEHPLLSPRFDELRGVVDSMARQIESVRGDLGDSVDRQHLILQQVEGLRHEVDGLSRTLGNLAPRASTVAIESALRDLVQRIDTQRQRGVADGELAPAERIAGELRAVLKDMDPAPKVRGLNADLRAIAERLDELRAPGQANATALRDLGRQTGEIKELLAALAARPLPLEQLETRLYDLTQRIEKLSQDTALSGRKGDIGEVVKAIRAIIATETGGTIQAFNQRLDRLSDKLDKALANFGGKRFDELGARIDDMHRSLVQRIDRGVAQKPADTGALENLVATLAKKIDAALEPGVDRRGVEQLEIQVEKLSQKLDRIAEHPSTAKIEELLAQPRPQQQKQLSDISDRLDFMHQALAARIEEGARQRSEVSNTQLADMVEQLSSKMNSALEPNSDPADLSMLGEQIQQLAARLDRTVGDGAALASIEGKIAELFARIEETRSTATEAAEAAVRRATLDVLRQATAGGALNPAVKHELDEIRRAQNESGARTHETLSAVHDTLERVVERLAVFEDELAEIRRAPIAETSSPLTVAPARERPREASKDTARSQSAVHTDERVDPLTVAIAPRSRRGRDVEDLDLTALGTTSAVRGADVETTVQANFIAAARRAAQKAAADAGVKDREPPRAEAKAEREAAPASPPAAGLGAAIAARKRPILLGLTGVVLLFGALQLAQFATVPGKGLTPVVRQDAKKTAGETSEGVETKAVASQPQQQASGPKDLSPIMPGKQDSPPVGAEETKAPTPAPTGAIPSAGPKAEGKSSLGERVDTMPVGAIDRLSSLSQDAAALQTLAARGDALAQYELGVRYADGRGGLPHDLKIAAQWFAKASDQGLAPAQYRLGSFYEKGVGVDRDFERARSLYQQAADAGNARAMHNLAVLFAEGNDGKPDYASAGQWFRKAAEYGVRDSQFNLAILCARGLGVGQSLTQSYMWFAIAASQGDADAAKKRDDVGARLDSKDLAAAKALIDGFKAKEPKRDANEVDPPKNGWQTLQGPAGKQPDTQPIVRPKVSRI